METQSLGDAVGARFGLRHRDNEWYGFCPITRERVPSFHVDAVTGDWRCSMCARAGTPARLLEIVEGLSFPDAMAALRGPLKGAKDEHGNRALRMRILAANDFAADYFRAYRQTHPAAAKARAYLADRGFEPATLDRFDVGFAPPSVDGVNDFDRAFYAVGFDEETGLQAGLLAKSERGIYPFFRNRIIIPMRTENGDTIGFGGRAILKHPRKYINTSLTPVHRKGAALYGMNFAADAILEHGEAIVVEGYFDEIAMQVAGFTNAVAALGTSFTLAQARGLARLGVSAIACFDADDAGRRAAERSLQTAAEAELKLRTVTLPEGLDPDDLIRTGGPDAMRQLLEGAYA